MDKPTITIGITENGLAGVEFEGFSPPKDLRIIMRDFTRGDTPDKHGDLYVDTDITDDVL